MYKEKYVFSLLLDLLNRNDFNYLANKNLAPNGKSATRGVPGVWPGHSLRAVWLQQAILL